MKLLLIPVAIALATSLHAATAVETNTGIGLGTEIFRNETGLLSQICAATTNASFGNQTFAITTGTLGARQWDGIVSNNGVKGFVHDNMDQLAREMAAGHGESLDALAELCAIPAAERGVFTRSLQDHFADIYTSPTVTDDEVVANLAKVVAGT